MFGNHGLCGLLEEGAHGKSPKCLDGNLGDFGEFCKGLRSSENPFSDDLGLWKMPYM
ncbi:NAD(P)H-flavin oxidoreductase [Neisseria mucosa]|uniref:NAD(P)H-flavin oxidoreductase n=1 Tax=Neisseria mucosa TaxID=488 RepID=A0ABM6JCF6_NEIMU|nr:NAD(P)H-flavin oxidoreductase [Neisseria mucosa]AVR78364.1 NAD(P)H-flavin oxidoreductase [Neisseria mucosa]